MPRHNSSVSCAHQPSPRVAPWDGCCSPSRKPHQKCRCKLKPGCCNMTNHDITTSVEKCGNPMVLSQLVAIDHPHVPSSQKSSLGILYFCVIFQGGSSWTPLRTHSSNFSAQKQNTLFRYIILDPPWLTNVEVLHVQRYSATCPKIPLQNAPCCKHARNMFWPQNCGNHLFLSYTVSQTCWTIHPAPWWRASSASNIDIGTSMKGCMYIHIRILCIYIYVCVCVILHLQLHIYKLCVWVDLDSYPISYCTHLHMHYGRYIYISYISVYCIYTYWWLLSRAKKGGNIRHVPAFNGPLTFSTAKAPLPRIATFWPSVMMDSNEDAATANSPRHPNTSWEGIWTPKTYLKHLLSRYLDVGNTFFLTPIPHFV